MSSASQNSDRDLGFATADTDLRDFLDRFDPITENGHCLTIENIRVIPVIPYNFTKCMSSHV